MKQFLKNAYLPLAAVAGGLLVYLMRTLLFASAIGDSTRVGLPEGSWPDVMSWILVASMVAFLAVGTWPLRGLNKYSYNFPASLPAAIGMALAGISFLISSILELTAGGDFITTLSSIFGIISAVSIGYLAFCRLKGLQLNVMFHGVICLYLMLHLISHYRLWSSYPQLQSYAFELLSIVFLMLACYQRAAFDAGKGNRRAYVFHSLMALFFCIATLPGCDMPVFFIGSGIWMLLSLCKLTIPSCRSEKHEE